MQPVEVNFESSHWPPAHAELFTRIHNIQRLEYADNEVSPDKKGLILTINETAHTTRDLQDCEGVERFFLEAFESATYGFSSNLL